MLFLHSSLFHFCLSLQLILIKFGGSRGLFRFSKYGFALSVINFVNFVTMSSGSQFLSIQSINILFKICESREMSVKKSFLYLSSHL